MFAKIFLFTTIALAAAVTHAQTASLKVSGEIEKELNITMSELGKMKQDTASLKDKGGQSIAYTGVSLSAILKLAGSPAGSKLRGKNLSGYVLVKCADNYKVIFSLAELDNDFTDKKVILATKMAGNDLPKDRGPFRIVVQDEKIPARSSYQVVELVIGSAK